MNHIPLAFLCLVLALVCISHAGEELEPDAFTSAVRTISPYDAFTNGYQNARTPSGKPIGTRENYEIFIRLAVKDYKTGFSLEEIRKIAAFYQSPLGKKFLQHSLDSDLVTQFIQKIDPESYPQIKSVWSCSDHPQIRTTSTRKCPICRKALHEQKLTK